MLTAHTDSFSGKANDASLEYVSKNLEAMKRFFENHNSLLMSLFSPSQKERETNKYNPLLQTIQVMLAPRYLTICPLMATWAFDFETSQRWMYGNSQQAPYFIGCNSLDVNMGLVLHAVNFWKYHLVREWEGTLFASFEDLEADEKPRYWTEQLKPGVQKLGRHWKGSYAFVDHTHIARMRSAKYEYGENQIQDEFNGEQEPDAFQVRTTPPSPGWGTPPGSALWDSGSPMISPTETLRFLWERSGISHYRDHVVPREYTNDICTYKPPKLITNPFIRQDLTLDFVDAHAMPWSEEFEKHLQSRTPPANKAKTRAQHRSSAPTATFGDPVPFSWGSFRFEGAGHDHVEDFHADGWLNPLPPQNGVLGWQRMTMMKYFVDPDTGFIDEAALWAYEGVVLPGGNIIMGRWWSPSDGTGVQQYSGPFILWNVDGPRFPESEYDKPSTRKSEKELNNYLG